MHDSSLKLDTEAVLYSLISRDVSANTERRPTPIVVMGALLWSRGTQAAFLYRLAHASHRHGVTVLSEVLSRIAQLVFHVDVSYKAVIGPGLCLRHAHGVVIGSEARLGSDITLFHNVTIGKRLSGGIDRPDGMATIGDGVVVGTGAAVLGPVSIGAEATVGANAVVTFDVPPRAVVRAARASVDSGM